MCNFIRIGKKEKVVGSKFVFAAPQVLIGDGAAASARNMLGELERGFFRGKKLA